MAPDNVAIDLDMNSDASREMVREWAISYDAAFDTAAHDLGANAEYVAWASQQDPTWADYLALKWLKDVDRSWVPSWPAAVTPWWVAEVEFDVDDRFVGVWLNGSTPGDVPSRPRVTSFASVNVARDHGMDSDAWPAPSIVMAPVEEFTDWGEADGFSKALSAAASLLRDIEAAA